MEITINATENLKSRPDDDKLGFGSIFSDNMFNMDYNPEKGWFNPRIEPYQDFQMDPATMVLHYGQAVFEGLKAFRNQADAISLFRARDNFKRLNRSSRALCIPETDEELVHDALKQLVAVEKEWVPHSPGTSLYIRPTIIATDPFLGVRASHTYRFFIIFSPVGAYYAEGFNPIKIWVSKTHVRAVRGGLGENKAAANYAASLYAGEQAHKNGYTQVLWLDGVEQTFVEEVGSMNIFFVINDELITPMLNGSILPGITRDSVMQLGRHWGITVTERQISIDEVFEAHKTGQLQEVFGTGTAAVISPVGELKYDDQVITIGEGKVGAVSQKLYDALTGIQYRRVEDPFGWVEEV